MPISVVVMCSYILDDDDDMRKGAILVSFYNWPAAVMVGGFLYLIEPELVPVASMAFTMWRDSSSATSPKTTCLPSSQLVTTVVMKNWDPLLEGRGMRFSICDLDGMVVGNNLRVGACVGH